MNGRAKDERFPVWDALSEFFLDTELGEADYQRIARTLASSDYTIEELQDILYYEVYPACKWNMFSIAGEWAGFHPDWVMRNIAPRKNRRPTPLFGPIHKWMFRNHWSQVSALVEKQRSEGNAS